MEYVFPLSSGIAHSKVNFPFSKLYSNGKEHKGIDLDATDAWIAKNGAPAIVATVAGTLYRTGYDEDGWGRYAVIEGVDGCYHIYAHMSLVKVREIGLSVKAGQQIGVIGTTGNSTGVHLHYEVRKSYKDSSRSSRLDPSKLLEIKDVTGAVKSTRVEVEKGDEDMIRYQKLEEVPAWAKATVEKLIAKKIIVGGASGLDLSDDMLRVLVWNDRARLYDK